MNRTPPIGLKDLDVVLFRPQDWIGKAITWAQWGLNVKSPEFCHCAVVITNPKNGELMLMEENWPRARWRTLDDVDWDEVAIMSYDGIELPFTKVAAARKWAEAQPYAQTYNIPAIGWFLLLGIIGRASRRASSRIRERQANPAFSAASMVCSALVDALFLSVLGLDMLPNIGIGECVPGDLTESVLHKHTFGRLG